MQYRSLGKVLRRRQELVFFVCVLALGVLAVRACLLGWLGKEDWGRPITTQWVESVGRVPEVEAAAFPTVDKADRRSPFLSVTAALQPGGRARIALPPVPPLAPEMPPPPMVRPVDLLKEGAK